MNVFTQYEGHIYALEELLRRRPYPLGGMGKPELELLLPYPLLWLRFPWLWLLLAQELMLLA